MKAKFPINGLQDAELTDGPLQYVYVACKMLSPCYLLLCISHTLLVTGT